MATADNERYLRYIFLLGKGGPLVLKGIANREVDKEGKTLLEILTSNRNRLQNRFGNNKAQYERLFPPAGAVNTDLDSWDISLLCTFILTSFVGKQKLTDQDRNDITIIRSYRNEIQGHFASVSLEEIDYNQYMGDLIVKLLNLARGLDRQIFDKIQDLIKVAKSGTLEIRSSLEDLKEFQTELHAQIEKQFGATHIKLDAIHEDLRLVKERELQPAIHQRLSDIEAKQDDLKSDTRDNKQLLQNIKDASTEPRKLVADDRQLLCNLGKGQDELKELLKVLLKEKIASQNAADQDNLVVEEDIETRMCIQSDTAEHASAAEDTLVLKINEILNYINHESIPEQQIRPRLQEILQRKPGDTDQAELIHAVLELILDIIKQPDTFLLSAEKSCIRLHIRCSTYQSILCVIEYIESETFRRRLIDIANAITGVTGNFCSLIAEIPAENVQLIFQKHAYRQKIDDDFLPFERTLKLPVRCRSSLGLEHVWKLFQEGNAKHHFERISNALSKIIGGKITITTSVDLEQFKQALKFSERSSTQKFNTDSSIHRHAPPNKCTKDTEGSIFETKGDAEFSHALSKVLDDLGLNTENIIRKRRTFLLTESIENNSNRLVGIKTSMYIVGSVVEVATIRELNSDIDIMFCSSNSSVIQNYIEWTPGVTNLIMLQDDTTPPGYYYLQYLREDIPVVSDELLPLDTKSEKQFKNILHGPSVRYSGRMAEYAITCLPCVSWPYESKQWFINKLRKDEWPTLELGRSIINKGCLLTNTGDEGTLGDKSLWRISFSLVERSLMFSLNSTQIKCLVLMKMLLRTFIYPIGVNFPTSYLCKTVLFHCISKSHSLLWQEKNLLFLFRYFFHSVYICVQNGYCPHFFIPRMNLVSNKMSNFDKILVAQVMSEISKDIKDIALLLLRIQIGDLGERITIKFCRDLTLPATVPLDKSTHGDLSSELIHAIDRNHTKIVEAVDTIDSRQTVSSFCNKFVTELIKIYRQSTQTEKKAYLLLIRLVTVSFGSIIAASNISKGFLSSQAYALMYTGLNSDVAAGRLKLASIFFCLGEREKTLGILMSIENRYDIKMVEPFCCCNLIRPTGLRSAVLTYRNETEIWPNLVAFCVKFVHLEYDCMPKELQYEMFKSFKKDKIPNEENSPLLTLVLVDSLPYLFFLQFKTYGFLGMKAKQRGSLYKLVQTIKTEPNIGHRETACNLVGQCYEEEGFFKHALYWFLVSLKVRDQKNAAKLHICRVLAKVVALFDS